MRLKNLIPTRLKPPIRALSRLRILSLDKLYACFEVEHLRKAIDLFDIDCVFDVGANFGQYAQMLRGAVGYQGLIISFEPIPTAIEALQNLAKRDERWIVVPHALSHTNGAQRFNVMESSQFSSFSRPQHTEIGIFKSSNKVATTIDVKTETLSSAFLRLKEAYGFTNPFLKLDTQGHDCAIIENSRNVINEFIGLQSELSIRRIYEDSVDYREAIQLYEACGFELSALVPNNSGHFPKLVEVDCIMFRSDLIQR